jgi:Bromodomain
MISKACNTIPRQKYKHTRNTVGTVESLDSDSVMKFLSHLGVPQYQVHKRITDSLIHELCEAIRNTSTTTTTTRGTDTSSTKRMITSTATSTAGSEQAYDTKTDDNSVLFDLLKSCWVYTTTIVELRPILWSILKQLGSKTPIPVLLALTERDDDVITTSASTTNTSVTSSRIKLKHAEIFKPLSLSLKQYCWEVDWEHYIPLDYLNVPDPNEFLQLVYKTLLYDTIRSDVDEYVLNPMLCDAANHPFVTSLSERRIVTTQRRALTKGSNTTTATTSHNVTGSNKSLTTGKAISHLRHLLCNAIGSNTGSSNNNKSSGTRTNKAIATMTYRPKLLYMVLSILMARYSISASSSSSHMLVIGGARHLYCTLIADILLLSAGGPLPKPYNDVLSLARALDDVVQEATISDVNLSKIQTLLKLIFQPDQTNETIASPSKFEATEQTSTSTTTSTAATTVANVDVPTNPIQRQLNRFIITGLVTMKECDPQQLFLNPVTDQIAPGYSAIIKQPMCISTMEQKVKNNVYHSVSDWENDVKLMYKNCIDYNRGAAGQWFRNEANRQSKIYREEIFPKATRLYQNEIAKSNFKMSSSSRYRPDDNDEVHGSSGLKRKLNDTGPEIVPLTPSTKKRKKEREDYIPSMPALASMLLADPFVVRIILARILSEFRRSVVQGQTVPCSNTTIPSLLQILHIIRYSKDICAIRGKKFFIPSAGIDKGEDPTTMVSYTCLRYYSPLLLRLILESELDRRITLGGDLYQASQSTATLPIPPTPSIHCWMDSTEQKAHVAVALLQGSIIHVCLPGPQTETSLSVSFPKFASALQGIADTSLLEDRIFLTSLQETIVRHKTKLPRSARDAIVAAWLGWLQDGDTTSILSPAHEILIKLLNDWYAFGNVLLPRDIMIRFCTNIVDTVSATKFSILWNSNSENFIPIKQQYEHMLKQLPESSVTQWIERYGINVDDDVGNKKINGSSGDE